MPAPSLKPTATGAPDERALRLDATRPVAELEQRWCKLAEQALEVPAGEKRMINDPLL
jgi:hypothetical protein